MTKNIYIFENSYSFSYLLRILKKLHFIFLCFIFLFLNFKLLYFKVKDFITTAQTLRINILSRGIKFPSWDFIAPLGYKKIFAKISLIKNNYIKEMIIFFVTIFSIFFVLHYNNFLNKTESTFLHLLIKILFKLIYYIKPLSKI